MELKQYIKKALNGDVVPSVEMGGLSEEYENAIQQLAFQMMVEFSQIGEYDKEKVNHIQVKCVNLLDSQHGFSGAQVGAATNLACVFWANFEIPETEIKDGLTHNERGSSEKGYFDLREYKMKHRKDQIIRNCVDPNVGQYVLGCAVS